MNTTIIAQSTDMARFTAKVQFPVNPDGCWLWRGARHGQGTLYGKFRLGGRVQNAHKASYLMFNGEVPAGMVVAHQCNNSACVNPHHLVAQTQSENCKYMVFCGRHVSQGGVKNAS